MGDVGCCVALDRFYLRLRGSEDVEFYVSVRLAVQLKVGIFRAVTGFSVNASVSYAGLCKNI